MARQPPFVRRLRSGDVVVRRHRLLKTHGIVVGFGGDDYSGFSQAWVRWDHPDTLPNPSLEVVNSLELLVDGTPVTGPETPSRARKRGDGAKSRSRSRDTNGSVR